MWQVSWPHCIAWSPFCILSKLSRLFSFQRSCCFVPFYSSGISEVNLTLGTMSALFYIRQIICWAKEKGKNLAVFLNSLLPFWNTSCEVGNYGQHDNVQLFCSCCLQAWCYQSFWLVPSLAVIMKSISEVFGIVLVVSFPPWECCNRQWLTSCISTLNIIFIQCSIDSAV
jgi:hypothetical protein